VPYADITTRERNRAKRWLQNRRLDDALYPLRGAAGWSGRHLDFGGGDGALSLRLLDRFPAATSVCFEPSQTIHGEAKDQLSGSLVGLVSDLSGQPPGAYDYITCCEVFEHLTDAAAREALRSISPMLAPAAMLVVGVPNEVFAVGLAKGIFRMTRRYGAYDAQWSTVGPAALGRPRTDRPVLDLDGLQFIFPHTGFDYRAFLRLAASEGFRLQQSYGSPMARAPRAMNSELYFVFSRNETDRR
jgi:hypothetical protein